MFYRGVPFNIASYSLLTIMIAQVTGLKPGDFLYCLGDTHIYNTHITALQEQITREPNPFPTLLLIKTNTNDIDSFTFDDFQLFGYKCHDSIKMTMAV